MENQKKENEKSLRLRKIKAPFKIKEIGNIFWEFYIDSNEILTEMEKEGQPSLKYILMCMTITLISTYLQYHTKR